MFTTILNLVVALICRTKAMNTVLRTLLCVSVFLLSACSVDDNNKDDGTKMDHVWKTQIHALEKARKVEQMLQDADTEKRRGLEQQTQ